MKRKLITTADSHEEYLSKTDYESASTIKLAVQSDQDYIWFKKASYPSTKSQAFGTALHMSILEPERFNSTYWCLKESDKVEPNATWITKANKDKKVELVAKNPGKECLDQDDWDAIQVVSERIIFDDRFIKFMSQSTKEQSFYVENFYSGLDVKCRPDSYMPTIEVDIKTTKAADPVGFWYEFIKYKYHIQRALAVDIMKLFGIKIEQSCILAVSSSPPYNHEFYRVPDHLIEAGRELYREGLMRIARIKSGDVNVGYISTDIQVDENGMIVLQNKTK